MEFQTWPKTPRLYKDTTITEKIDGSNAAVVIEKLPVDYIYDEEFEQGAVAVVENWDGDHPWLVGAQSRKRLLHPDDDNFGFAQWVYDNAEGLVETLGEGRHFGEWWGHGIQRGYGCTPDERYFSLFNTKRWNHLTWDSVAPGEIRGGLGGVPGLDVVPVLDQHTFNEWSVVSCLDRLRRKGSVAAPGFNRPEGVVVFHHGANHVFKAFVEEK